LVIYVLTLIKVAWGSKNANISTWSIRFANVVFPAVHLETGRPQQKQNGVVYGKMAANKEIYNPSWLGHCYITLAFKVRQQRRNYGIVLYS
jgi:hypothetical protein